MQPSFNCVVFTFTRKSFHSFSCSVERTLRDFITETNRNYDIQRFGFYREIYHVSISSSMYVYFSKSKSSFSSINYQYSTSRTLIPMQQTVAARQYSIWIHLDYPPFDIDPLFSCLCVSAEGTSYFFTSVTEYFHSQHQLIISKINSIRQF